MSTDLREKKMQEVIGRPGEFRASTQYPRMPEQGHSWNLVQGTGQPDTKAQGFSITVFTPMHGVKFSDSLWAKLDQMSARTPDPVMDEDDEL